MFVGHYGACLAGKSVAPRASLGTWLLSTQFLDLLWPLMLLAGVEHVRIDPGNTRFTPLDFEDYPVTHSLVGALGWSVAFGVVHLALRRRRATACLLAAGVFSHWVLDAIVHRPDLPLAPGGGPRVGLGLWNSPAATIALESAIFLGGLALYARATRAPDRTGRWALAGFVAFLVVLYSWSAASPPPPSAEAVAWSGIGQWLLVAWAYWIDRHRVPA